MSAPVILETERLLLRPHSVEDYDAMLAMNRDAGVVRYISGSPLTREETWLRLLRFSGLWPTLGFGFFAVTDKITGEFIGEAGLADFHRDIEPSLDGFAEAGWVFASKAHGKGIANEAVKAVFAWYAKQPKQLPLTAIVHADNAASIRLAERLGFRESARTTYKGAPTIVFRRS